MNKIAIRLAMGVGGEPGYYLALPLYELKETVDDYLEVLKENGGKR